MDTITLNLSDAVARRQLAAALGYTHEGDRNVYSELGYPQLSELDFDDFWGRFKRQGLARRIVRLPVLYTWRKAPILHDGKFDSVDTTEGTTPFLDDWRRLDRKEHILRFCRTVDRLAGIGRYAVLLLGLADAQPLDQPVISGSLTGPGQLLYLNAFAEGDAGIDEWDDDPKSTRFGQPIMYNISLADMDGDKAETVAVHWSRVIHVAEEPDSGVVFGTPRLEAVWNNLQDLDKTIGGAAEAVWINANRGLHVDIRDGFELDPDSADALSDEIDEYIHKMRRVIRTTGANVNPLGSDVPDPTGIVSVIISQIAAATDIPNRILIGSERGELASSTDQDNLQMVMEDRQINFAEPTILRELIDRLVLFGVMQPPANGEYGVTWPPVYGQKPLDVAGVVEVKARTAKTLTDAGAGVVAAGLAAGFSELEAQSFLLVDINEMEQ